MALPNQSALKTLTGTLLSVLVVLYGCTTVKYETVSGAEIFYSDLRFHYERLVTKSVPGRTDPPFQFVSFVYPPRNPCAKPGDFDVRAVVDPATGSFRQVKLAVSATDAMTGANTVSAVARWSVRPFTVDGTSTPFILELPFRATASKDCFKPHE